jgi:hypothetical protein
MQSLARRFMNLTTGIGDLIDTIIAIFFGLGELFRALWAILRLIGRLAGG